MYSSAKKMRAGQAGHLHINVLTPVSHKDIFQSAPVEFTG
jgi:hypothetical protein